MLYEEELTEKIMDAAIEVHRALGPGLLDSTYQAYLAKEFARRGLKFVEQKSLPAEYKELRLESGYRLAFLVEDKIVVELKAVDSMNAVHEAQLLTYLKLTGCKVALLINFNVAVLKNRIVRKVL